MVITGQAGSGLKGQTDRKKYSPWEERGKGREWRGGHAEDLYRGWRRWDCCEGTWVTVALQNQGKSVA